LTAIPRITSGRGRALSCLLLAFSCWLTSGSGRAEEQTPPKQAFLHDLQHALRKDDRVWIADHMRYPARYNGRVANVIRNRNDFVRNYSVLISDRLRAAVLSQLPDKVFENWQGMMIGDGTHNMWVRDAASGDGTRYEIVTINDSN
jgi:hypothetical protein